jgi:hypothetical protein
MTPTTTPPAILRPLALQEIHGYLRSRLFCFGALLWVLLCVSALMWPDKVRSTTGDGIGSAMVLGVLGIVVMAGSVRNSDRAAAASGVVVVPQRTRTLALAAATVVPGIMALIWFGSAIMGYHLNPPSPAGAPFGQHSELDFYAAMFAEGVTPAVGGPLLGLVIGRWRPGRGTAPLLAVAVVLVSVVMQPMFGWAVRPRLAWIWTHFYGNGGVDGDPDRLVALPGSPYFYIGYQVALCVLGVLVAMYRDPESDRSGLKRRIVAVVGVAVLLCGLASLVGPSATQPSPVPSQRAGT